MTYTGEYVTISRVVSTVSLQPLCEGSYDACPLYSQIITISGATTGRLEFAIINFEIMFQRFSDS